VLTGLKLSGGLSDRILKQSARGWFMSDQRNQKQKIKMVFYDEHGLDRQRAYNIVCMMVGGNPEKFSDLADTTKLPDERQGTCQGDLQQRVVVLEQGPRAAHPQAGSTEGRHPLGLWRHQEIRSV
jgi:hypothetical protein